MPSLVASLVLRLRCIVGSPFQALSGSGWSVVSLVMRLLARLGVPAGLDYASMSAMTVSLSLCHYKDYRNAKQLGHLRSPCPHHGFEPQRERLV